MLPVKTTCGPPNACIDPGTAGTTEAVEINVDSKEEEIL